MASSVAAIKAVTVASMFEGAAEVTRHLRPAQPVQLFCPSQLQRQVRRFQSGFKGQVSFAVKANHEPRVITTLAAAGIRHFDVASLGEVAAVARMAPRATLHFNNPVKAQADIALAYRQFGVRSFALDDRAELAKICQVVDKPEEVLFSVRFKLDHDSAAYDFGEKFGAGEEMAAELLRAVAAMGGRTALTFHPGSQCADPLIYERYLRAAARICGAAAVVPEQINVGGGFPEHYDNVRVPMLEHYLQRINRAASDCFTHRPSMMCEPGRAMVASAVSLLAQVIHVRDDARTLFLNDGVYGALLEQSVVDLRLPVRVWRRGHKLAGPACGVRVFGPTCDPIDRVSGPLQLPTGIRVGDYLEFGLLGAYGSVTATGFNGFAPARYVDVRSGFGQA